ncbi:MAG: T9SS type A sorting domain-containing protein [Flavobacteriales bacterium]|nr:T9SS type A sorting domain-containing protein [Flavobacteriales bacterium]
MNRTLTLSALAFVAAPLLAQPVIEASENQPEIGDAITVNSGAFTSAGAAGNDQTYDFSGLTSTGTRIWTYLDPAVYPDAGTLFPTANIAMTDGTTDTTFYAMSGTALTVVGEDAALLTFGYTAPLAQGPDLIRWPATLNDSWSGPISATFDIDGVGTFTRSGSYTAVVDGAGTLVLPGGTSMAVIRVRFNSTEVNAGPLVTVTRKKEIYSYHTRFKAHPVVRIINDSLSSNLGPSLNTLVTEWLDATEVGIDERSLAFSLAPNPAGDLVVLTTERPVAAVELRDAAGRALPVNAARIQGTRVELGLSGLRPGFYLVQVTATDGGRATRRLVVE